jgi:hypothetical protein
MARKRMIDPGIWDSEQVQSLTLEQFKLYLFMISQADDYGRCKVSIPIFKVRVHPMKEYADDAFKSDLEALSVCGLMKSYFVDGEWFMYHPNWKEYQYIQKVKPSKLPVPDEYNIRTVPVPPNRIELNRIEKNNEYICTEQKISAPVPVPSKAPKIPGIDFDFEIHAWEGISDEQVIEWGTAYPALNIEVELSKAKEWVLANPKKRKKNWRKFLVGWFGRAQERGGDKTWKR